MSLIITDNSTPLALNSAQNLAIINSINSNKQSFINSNMLSNILIPYITSNVFENKSNILNNAINTKQNILTASTSLLGDGSAITNLDYNKITLNKPTNFQADWNTTIINKPTIYTQTEVNNLLSAKEQNLTFNAPLTRTTNTIGINLNSYTPFSALLSSNYVNFPQLLSSNYANYSALNSCNYITNSTSGLNNYYDRTTTDARYTQSNFTPSFTQLNSCNYITNSTSGLVNYYNKTESDIITSNFYTSDIIVFSAERQYPPKLYNSVTAETTTTFLGKSVYTQTITLNTTDISYGSGDYIIYSSSTYGSLLKNLLYDLSLTNEAGSAFQIGLYNSPSGIYNGANFIVSGYTGDWIILKLPVSIILTKFSFKERSSLTQRAPAEWKCYGSIDGITFTEIIEASQSTRLTASDYPSGLYTKTLNTSFNTPYLYIGWTFNKIVGGLVNSDMVNFNEIQIYGKERSIPFYISSNVFNSTLTNYSTTAINDNNYLKKIGGNMSGDINMNSTSVINFGQRGDDNLIKLWTNGADTYGFGINSYTLRYNTPNAASHKFYIGGTNVATINSSGLISTSFSGDGTNITNINYENITGKPTNFQADWNSTIINRPTYFPPDPTIYYNKTETNNLLSAKEETLTFNAPLTRTTNSIGINLNSYTPFSALIQSNYANYSALNSCNYITNSTTGLVNYSTSASNDATYLKLSGGTLSGDITLNANITTQQLYINNQNSTASIIFSPNPSIYSIFSRKVPWAIYFAEDYNIATNTLPNYINNGRDATTTGTITKTTASGNGATGAITYISGTTTSTILFPVGSIPSTFTILSLTRYSGANKRRILQSTANNWLHGFWAGNRGVAYYEGWKTNVSSTGNQNDWLCFIGKNVGATPNNILVDGVGYGIAAGGAGGGTFRLGVNSGTYGVGESSEWELSCVMIWDTALTDAEMVELNNIINIYKNDGASIKTLISSTIDDDSVIESRVYSGSEKTELLLFKGNDGTGTNGIDRIRLKAGNIAFDTYSILTPSSSRNTENIVMLINENGNVGIGTTNNLTSKLNVNGSINSSSLYQNETLIDFTSYATNTNLSTNYYNKTTTDNLLNAKQGTLTFSSPLNNTANNITIDLSSKENVLTFSSPLTRNTNTIGINLSSYSTTGDDVNYLKKIGGTITGNLEINGKANIHNGNPYSVPQGKMANGSLTIGDQLYDFGGGSGWNTNTAGLMFECSNNTEIAVHDAANRIASLMYFEGGGTNKITIGRNMGWDAISSVDIKSALNITGELKNQYWKFTNQDDYCRLYNNAGTAYFNFAAAQLYANTSLQVNSTANINGVLTMGSGINFKNDVWNYSTDNIYRTYYATNGTSYYQGNASVDLDFLHLFRDSSGNNKFGIYKGVNYGIYVWGQVSCSMYTSTTQNPHDYVGVPYETAASSFSNYTLYLILNSFTGFHRNFTNDELFDENNPQLFKNNYEGRIVVATGKIRTQIGNEKDGYDIKNDKEGIGIEDAHPLIELSRKKKDKRVFGVLGRKDRKNSNEKRMIVNSVGEGSVWVCNSNKNIENGDYIQSSDHLGFGERQDDDLLHNYTCAKALMDCSFELDSPYYNCIEIDDLDPDGNRLRIAFIAVSYHCG